MKKSYLFAISCLISSSLYASPNCDQLAKIAENNGEVQGLYKVKSLKGLRSYFYSAPSEQCKSKNVFIISKDTVFMYQKVKNENQWWMYVMYTANDGVTDTQGWVKVRDFDKLAGRTSPHLD